jgi:hypothetical protein
MEASNTFGPKKASTFNFPFLASTAAFVSRRETFDFENSSSKSRIGIETKASSYNKAVAHINVAVPFFL